MTTGARLCTRCGRISESGAPICTACEISAAVRGPTTEKEPTIPQEPQAAVAFVPLVTRAAYERLAAEHQRVLAETARLRQAIAAVLGDVSGWVGDELRSAVTAIPATGWLSPQEAERLRAETREKTLDELALAIGFGERPWGQSGVHRPDDLAEAIRQALKERDDEIDRRGAYVDAWDEYFRAVKGSDRERRQLAAISKARDAWERDTDPEDR